MKRKLLLLGLFSFVFVSVKAQEKKKPALFGKQFDVEAVQASGGIIKCASYEYEQHQRALYPKLGTKDDFESWLAPKVQAYKVAMSNPNMLLNEEVITIPVVVHVLHSNKPYGVQENISDEQIFSQIEVLNEDFRNLSGSSISVAADVKVQFCLAQRTPDGQETNGIVRINQVTPSQGYFVDVFTGDSNIDSIKPSTQWDPSQYLNIWVVDQMVASMFGFPAGEILGIAQFPQGSGLDGLEGAGLPSAVNTDGVVIGHKHFGSYLKYPSGTYASSSTVGRTPTHEVGHWLGLRHIYGDDPSCSVDDYCPDTPNATSHLEQCVYRASCGVEEMKENYMNYTPETCQNTFTQDQKIRIRTVLANSPLRVTLATSQGCVPAQTYGFDARINIVNAGGVCDLATSPIVKLTNNGESTVVTSAEISYGVAGNLQTHTWNGSLATGANTDITLPAYAFNPGSNNFTATLVSVNGTNDENPNNNTATLVTTKANNYENTTVELALTPDNYGSETTWELRNSSNAVVYSGGPYTDGDTNVISEIFNLTNGECYTFTIFDQYSDGICCSYGTGSYSLTSGSQTIVSGGSFSASESTTFKVGTASVENNVILNGIRLYPNPTKGILNIATLDSELPESYVIYNTVGQAIKSVKIGNSSDLTVDTSSFADGIYLITIVKEGQSKTLRFVKQ